ncbi:tyrosine-type recombinase/integrase [Acetobacter sp.]|uniref:tyrosine-type recombinase/integrase n=1 Tax=Acetobacter sp. TaxID=440 RepID=UPI0039E82E0D
MLTELEIRNLQPQAKNYKKSDGEGLYLLIKPNGVKSWRFKYRFAKKEQVLVFGNYPSVSTKQARLQRNEAKKSLSEGIDPSLLRRQKRAEAENLNDRFQVVAESWLTLKGESWSAKYSGHVRSSLERMVWPKLGQLSLGSITAPMILSIIKSIERRDARETAHRVLQRVSAVFVYGMACGLTDTNPAESVRGALKPVRRARQPAITDLHELREMLRTLERLPAHPITILAIRFLAITAVRPGEVHGMPWHEWKGDLWEIPADRMKMKRSHTVPLSRQAIEILQTAQILTGRGPMVFPNTRWAHRAMSENTLSYFMKRAGYGGIHVPHGFRASFSSIMNDLHPEYRGVIDLMLAHVPANAVEAAYNRAQHVEARRKLAQEYADLLLEGFPPPSELLGRERK